MCTYIDIGKVHAIVYPVGCLQTSNYYQEKIIKYENIIFKNKLISIELFIFSRGILRLQMVNFPFVIYILFPNKRSIEKPQSLLL